MQQDNVGRFFSHVNGIIDGDSDIGCFHGFRVINAGPHVGNGMAFSAQGSDDTGLLIGSQFGKDLRLFDLRG